jgi:hypothetical protein
LFLIEAIPALLFQNGIHAMYEVLRHILDGKVFDGSPGMGPQTSPSNTVIQKNRYGSGVLFRRRSFRQD